MSEKGKHLKYQFFEECLLYNMPESFVLSMKNNQSFRESSIKKVKIILEESKLFNNNFKVAFDVKSKSI